MAENLQVRKKILLRYSALVLVAAMLAMTGLVSGQSELVTVTIRLRNSQGAPIAGESVVLERLQDGAASSHSDVAELPACATGVDGVCSWQAPSGIYQLFFDRPLDEVTRLALAEGGLRGYGITVGEEPVNYHFTFHHDGFVYFDSDPLAPRPAAVMPSLEDLHLEYVAPAAATTLPIAMEEASAAPLAETPASAIALQVIGEDLQTTSSTSWLLLLAVVAGLVLAAALPLILRTSRLRPVSNQAIDLKATRPDKAACRPLSDQPSIKPTTAPDEDDA